MGRATGTVPAMSQPRLIVPILLMLALLLGGIAFQILFRQSFLPLIFLQNFFPGDFFILGSFNRNSQISHSFFFQLLF